ncbi:MAG: tetratricopeptide repeat protein [Deferrisomatales bacterium]
MTRPGELNARLAALGGREATAPLWIESLEPERALGELAAREGPLFRLQEAHFLLAGGRVDEASAVLAGLRDLPAGLAALRGELVARAGRDARPRAEPSRGAAPGLATVTLAELYARQGDVAAAIATYEAVLAIDPSDRRARQGLDELTGRGPAGPARSALERWLERVRGWRRARGG